jgi:hypothetical protein
MCCRVMILRQDASAWQNLTSLAVMSIMIHCSIRVLPTGFREGEAMPKTRTGLRASHVVAIGVIVVGLLVYNLHPTFSGAQNPAQQAPGGRPTAVWPNVKPTASSSEDTVRFEATWATTEGIVTSVKYQYQIGTQSVPERSLNRRGPNPWKSDPKLYNGHDKVTFTVTATSPRGDTTTTCLILHYRQGNQIGVSAPGSVTARRQEPAKAVCTYGPIG